MDQNAAASLSIIKNIVQHLPKSSDYKTVKCYVVELGSEEYEIVSAEKLEKDVPLGLAKYWLSVKSEINRMFSEQFQGLVDLVEKFKNLDEDIKKQREKEKPEPMIPEISLETNLLQVLKKFDKNDPPEQQNTKKRKMLETPPENPHKIPIICPHDDCRIPFPSVTELMKHAKIIHWTVPQIQNTDRRRCEICVKSVQINELDSHLEKEHPNMNNLVQCQTCHQFFPNTGSLSRHMLVHRSNKAKTSYNPLDKIKPAKTTPEFDNLDLKSAEKLVSELTSKILSENIENTNNFSAISPNLSLDTLESIESIKASVQKTENLDF